MHIGDMPMRFAKVTPRSCNDVNNAGTVVAMLFNNNNVYQRVHDVNFYMCHLNHDADNFKSS